MRRSSRPSRCTVLDTGAVSRLTTWAAMVSQQDIYDVTFTGGALAKTPQTIYLFEAGAASLSTNLFTTGTVTAVVADQYDGTVSLQNQTQAFTAISPAAASGWNTWCTLTTGSPAVSFGYDSSGNRITYETQDFTIFKKSTNSSDTTLCSFGSVAVVSSASADSTHLYYATTLVYVPQSAAGTPDNTIVDINDCSGG